MIAFMPADSSALDGLTPTGNAYPGHSISNCVDAVQISRPTLLETSVKIVAGVNDKIDFNEGGGELTATLTAGVYRNLAALNQERATQMDAVGAQTHYWTYEQHPGSGTYHVLKHYSSGSSTLLTKTGTNVATSDTILNAGFSSNQDSSAGTSHTGHYPVVGHNFISGDGPGIQVDLATNPPYIEAVIFYGLMVSPACRPRFRMGATATATTVDQEFGQFDRDLCAYFMTDSNAKSYRYFTAHLFDSREDTCVTGIKHIYAGPVFQPARGWDPSSFAETGGNRVTLNEGLNGQAFMSAAVSGQQVTFQLGAQTMSASDWVRMAQMFTALGRNKYCYVAMDPDNEPSRETRLLMFPNAYQAARKMLGDRDGRYSIALNGVVV